MRSASAEERRRVGSERHADIHARISAMDASICWCCSSVRSTSGASFQIVEGVVGAGYQKAKHSAVFAQSLPTDRNSPSSRAGPT